LLLGLSGRRRGGSAARYLSITERAASGGSDGTIAMQTRITAAVRTAGEEEDKRDERSGSDAQHAEHDILELQSTSTGTTRAEFHECANQARSMRNSGMRVHACAL
jgi:hypothetical protein